MKIVLFLLLIFYSSVVSSQKKLVQNASSFLSSDISLQRMDAFLNVGYKKRVRYVEAGINVGLGIEKSFFQKRFSPHIECFTFYNLFQKEKDRRYGFVFGPGLFISATTYKIEQSLNYFDSFLAYQISLGRTIKFFHQAGYGLMIESFVSGKSRITNMGNNYFAKIGVIYAFH